VLVRVDSVNCIVFFETHSAHSQTGILQSRDLERYPKAVSRYACHRTPNPDISTV